MSYLYCETRSKKSQSRDVIQVLSDDGGRVNSLDEADNSEPQKGALCQRR